MQPSEAWASLSPAGVGTLDAAGSFLQVTALLPGMVTDPVLGGASASSTLLGAELSSEGQGPWPRTLRCPSTPAFR